MSTAYPIPDNISPATVKNTASLLRIVALTLISGAAIASRLFAVVNFESIIHELYVYHCAFQASHLTSSSAKTAIRGSISACLYIPTAGSNLTYLQPSNKSIGSERLLCTPYNPIGNIDLMFRLRNFGIGSTQLPGTHSGALLEALFTQV